MKVKLIGIYKNKPVIERRYEVSEEDGAFKAIVDRMTDNSWQCTCTDMGRMPNQSNYFCQHVWLVQRSGL